MQFFGHCELLLYRKEHLAFTICDAWRFLTSQGFAETRERVNKDSSFKQKVSEFHIMELVSLVNME